MSEVEIGTFLAGDGIGIRPKCPECNLEKVELVDVLSIEEKPWSLPVWQCHKCKYLFSGRSMTMQNTALNFARASKKYIVDKVHGQMPSIKQAEEFNRRMSPDSDTDPIKELRKSIKGFKLK